MARHYKQSPKDRMHESKGMKKYEKMHKKGKGHRDHSDALMMPRDSTEHRGMEEETQLYHMGKAYYGPGYGHPSNLPPYPDIKYYPKEASALHTDGYPDTIREIDEDGMDNMRNLAHQRSDTMY